MTAHATIGAASATSGAVTGTLIDRRGRSACVELGGMLTSARIGFGCIVAPEPGDLVLTVAAQDAVWVLAVLDRPTAAPLCLAAEGDIALVSTGGAVRLAAAGDVGIDAGGRVRVSARQIDLHAGVARIVIDEILHVGRRLTAHAARIRVVGELFETFAEHVLLRTRRSSRFVTESDDARAGSVDHRAAGTMQLHAKSAFVTAETVVRVDAEQIHMG